MALQIEGGFGNRTPLDIDDSGRAQVVAVFRSTLFDNSLLEGQAFSWSSGSYDYDAGDTILLIKNTSSTKNLHVEEITLSGDADTRVVTHFPNAEVTVTGAPVIGTNISTLSANVAAAEAAQDETDNVQGSIIWSGEIHANQNPLTLNFSGALIVAQGKSLAIDYISAGSACDVTVIGFYI